MGDERLFGSFWVEEINGEVQTSAKKKRKYQHKKKEYNGWGSTLLIQFLESIGRDTSNKISQSDVTQIITDYVNQNNLRHPTKKKRIECDARLFSLFGRKTISRLKISDLLESHFAENCGESDDGFLLDSEDDEYAPGACETPKPASLERKSQPRKYVVEKPRSCFAAINPFNIKLVYLKKSLVEELLKDPETFKTKVVGSFIRIKCDPNDYLQKNSHQLLQITGIKKSSGVDGEILLQASGFIKDISIKMLQDDDFSEAECEDLHRRVKDGILKRPMIVDLEEKARVLHEDMTKHWLAKELALLQNLIDRANEKGWRRELDGYLQKRAKLKTPEEQERLLREIPQVIAEDLESESTTPDVPEKKLPTNFQELSQTTCTKVSLVTEVPKAVADDFSDEDDFADDQEWLFHNTPQVITGYPEFSKSKTPEIPDKKAENNIQGIWEATCMTASIVPEVQKVVANGIPQVTTGYPEFSKSKTPEIPDKKAENNMQGIWEATCMTGSIVPEVPRVVANGIPQGTTGYPEFSKSKTPEIPDKKAENNLQGFWEATCMTGSIVPEVPKVVANGIPQVTTGYLDFSKSKTPEVPVKKAENNMQGFWEANCIKASIVPEVPKAVANGFVFMGKRFHVADQTKQESESPKSILSLSRPSEVPLFNIAMNNTAPNGISRDTVTSTVHQRSSMSVQQQPATQTFSSFKKDGVFMPAKSNEVTVKAKISQGPSDKQVRPAPIQVIELSDDDDEENEKPSTIKPSFIKPVPVENPHSSMWHYIDPQGHMQGPFPLVSLKCWNDSRYFSPDFKVWKAGQTKDQSVLLVDILSKFFPVGPSFM